MDFYRTIRNSTTREDVTGGESANTMMDNDTDEGAICQKGAVHDNGVSSHNDQ